MPINCILPKQAEKLKKALRSGELSISKLFNISSSERVSLLTQYVGEASKTINASLEKAYLSPNQKLAMRNWIFKNVAQAKPLYSGITLEQSKKMFENLKMQEIIKMTDEKRISELSKYVNVKLAENLNKRFNALKKSGNIANWEERVLGTKKIRENNKLKGSLAKLEALNDLGVLNPSQLKNFMQSFVETKLGVDITFEESKKLSELVKKQQELFDKIEESGDWTADNYQDNLNYRIAIDNLKKYEDKLRGTKSAVDVGNDLVEIGRNNILGSAWSGINSALYQFIPSLERFTTKRITLPTLMEDGSLMDKISNKIATGMFADKDGIKFIKNQLMLGLEVYDKTSVDTSRMSTLDDGYSFFGETERTGAIPISQFRKGLKERVVKPIKESKGIKNKIFSGVKGYNELTGNFPKWMAGGTDTIIATVTRAETSVLWSNEIAGFEEKTNNLPKGMTKKSRAKQLLKDSYNPNTKDEKAQLIKEAGILDAHYSNNTQPDGMADWVVGFRNDLGIGKFKFGKLIVPFAKITSTTISKGLQTAVPIGIVKELKNLNSSLKNENKIDGAKKANKAISNLVGFVGLTATSLLIASLLDDDDYIPPYAALSDKEYKLAEARGARPSTIRIGGVWIPIRYLPIISIPLSSIMMARQAKAKGESVIWGYTKGMLTQILDTPVISEIYKLIGKGVKSVKKSDLDEVSKITGLNMEDILDWAKIRIIPSMISRDLYNAVLPTNKYNFLGEEVEKGKIFRDDKSNAVLLEFNRLDKTGNMPTISDPTGEYAKELESKIGEDEYNKFLSELQKEYANRVENKINSWGERVKDEDKKKQIDKIREVFILNQIKIENRRR